MIRVFKVLKSVRTAGLLALILFSVLARAQIQTPIRSEPLEIPDPGTLTGSTYTNKYFGLRITVPSDWHVQDSAYKKQLSERGKDLITGDNQAAKSEIEKAVDNVTNLLAVTQYPVGTKGVLNASFTCGAEKVPGIRTDDEYMQAVKNTLPYSRVPQTITRDVYTEQIGGVPFLVIELQTKIPGVTLNEKYCAHLMKGYVLFFISIYGNDEQLKVQNQILASIVLR